MSLHPSTQKILDILKSKGHRMTSTRKEVIDHLVKQAKPIAAQELLSHFKKKGRVVNKTTIYREILFLKEAHVINEIDLLEGQKRYELHDPTNHHHHLVCINCKTIMCVEMPGDLDRIEKEIKKKYKFEVTGHVLEFFGKCNQCGA
jgi:Fur family ferric uptake transcriptional regulator